MTSRIARVMPTGAVSLTAVAGASPWCSGALVHTRATVLSPLVAYLECAPIDERTNLVAGGGARRRVGRRVAGCPAKRGRRLRSQT